MTSVPRPTSTSLPAAHAVLAGVVAGATALAAGELVAGLVPSAPSPLAAVGTAVIDAAPPGAKELVVALFGTADKVALLALVTLAVLGAGAAHGLLARRRGGLVLAAAGITAVAGIGALCAIRVPTADVLSVGLAATLQVVVGIDVLVVLLAAGGRTGGASGEAAAGEAAPPATAAAGRRGFLLRTGGLAALAIAGGALGRALLERRAQDLAGGAGQVPGASPAPGATAMPAGQVVDPAPTPPPDASLQVAGITPLVIPNGEFYRIDTALITPAVDASTWTLRVHGMVEREVTLTYAQLLELPLIERYVTIACVSNEVGGDLVGNAKWTGVRLTDVLAMAGVQAAATQIVPRSVDGWTAGFPTAWLTAAGRPRDALVAVRMNDVPLPAAHGFPARLIVPGLYGYVSATKWLTEIELTTLEAFDAYWVPKGWSKEAPILTQSRIDVPARNAAVSAGPVAVAGVAWAPERGIAKVEVSVDGGDWQEARLSTPLGTATWLQWTWTWQATSGSHSLSVRATDGTGDTQTADVTRPDPDGARGHHTITVQVA